ncbi:MAG TPA: MFS transporter, partial [Noviherbaspirillum sp.]
MAKTATYDGSAGGPRASTAGDDARNINTRGSHIAPGEIAIGVVIGRASEYFDFFVYAIASVLVFPAVFFPFAGRLEGTLWAFALLALAFVVRPIGTVIFMAIQRRYSREAKLTLALFILGLSTAGIAFLPTYEHLG